MSTALVYANNPNMRQYGPLELARGQVFRMMNMPRDLQLLGHAYVVALDEPFEPVRCLGCGRDFRDEGTRAAHAQRARHPAVDLAVGPLREPIRPLSTPDPDGPGDWPLEPEGAPPPPPLEEVGLASDRGARRERTAKGPREVIRLGG